jgi:hypothetical protein
VSALQPRDQRRAALSAGLLTSSHDGEVVAAARALCGLLAKGGFDPRGVVAAGLERSSDPASTSRPQAPAAAGYYGTWKQRARMARLSPYLNDWERSFLTDITNQASLSARQEDKLKVILVKSEGPQS